MSTLVAMLQERIIDILSWLYSQSGMIADQKNIELFSLSSWPSLTSLANLDWLPRNALVPLLAIALVFWPILVSLFYAFMTASTWIIWLFTSVVLGCLQVMYVTYQFVMITIDLAGLSVLKSYSMIRQQVLNLLDIFGGGNGQYKSRRRLWKDKLQKAETYENFLKIRIEPKVEVTAQGNGSAESHGRSGSDGTLALGRSKGMSHSHRNKTDSALPPRPSRMTSEQSPSHNNNHLRHSLLPKMSAQGDSIARSNSFDTKLNSSVSKEEEEKKNDARSTILHDSIPMTKSRSFSNLSQRFGTTKGQSSRRESSTSQQQHDGVDPIVSQELGQRTAYLLVATTERLVDARRQVERQGENADVEAWNRLQYLLSAVVKRNHLNLDDILVDNARSVSDTGRYGLTSQTRQAIRNFYEQVQKCLDLLADGPLSSHSVGSSLHSKPNHNSQDNKGGTEASSQEDGSSPRSSTSSLVSETLAAESAELGDRLRVVRRMKQNMGRTALMLSGGGAQAMYHLGVIRGLIQSKLYHEIQVISGTSGGSIAAAMCALKTPEELFRDVCVRTVSTDFKRNGEQKRENIRWFPTIQEMAIYWLNHKLLMSKDEFRRTCEFYYGDATFEEAFERTGKHVCITVSASRASGDTAQRLLLNHISTPRVTLASAVAASCALPGVMAPNKLFVKNSVGELEPFEVDGVEWIDGSVQADLPFQRISTLFAISNFIVSQTNFHVVPFLNKAHHPNRNSLYWKLFQTMEWDIRSRALKLSRLGLFPRIFGQDISKVFKQKYHGNLTIVPRFTTMQTFGLNALSNPDVKDMEVYIGNGEIATWPYLNAIRDMIRLEKVIDDCLARLEQRLSLSSPFLPDASWFGDDGYSITSSSGINVISPNPGIMSGGPRVKIVPSSGAGSIMSGSHRGGNGESSKLKRKVLGLEEENRSLKEQLLQLQQQLQGSS
mmetsp:Transcript_6555/g.16851  ORF Transcript_6555/g.16851 Transcript_6555/m.16851 type:complete len:945 (-) Transcript_6555:71-2905(-)